MKYKFLIFFSIAMLVMWSVNITQAASTDGTCTGDIAHDFAAAQDCANKAQAQAIAYGYNASCSAPLVQSPASSMYYFNPTCTINGSSGHAAQLLVGYDSPGALISHINPGWNTLASELGTSGSTSSSGTSGTAGNIGTSGTGQVSGGSGSIGGTGVGQTTNSNQCPAAPTWNGIGPDGKPAWAGMINGTQPAVPGSVNPYVITADYYSKDAASQVVKYLGGTIGTNINDDIRATWPGDPSVLNFPHDNWQVIIGGKTYAAYPLAYALNQDSPDLLRVFLASQGISSLGPAPLSACMSYISNYTRNPSATDPGPLPAYVTCTCGQSSTNSGGGTSGTGTSGTPTIVTTTPPVGSTGGTYSSGDIVSPSATQSSQQQAIGVSNKITAIGTDLINSAFQQFNSVLGLSGNPNISTNSNTTGNTTTNTPSTTSTGGNPNINQNSSTSSGGCFFFDKDLRLADTGSDVTALTTILVQQGLMTSTQSVFDSTVYDAVVAYQNKYKDNILTPSGLTAGTGFVGPSTRAYLNAHSCATGIVIATPLPTTAVIPGQFRYLRISSTETGWISWREIEVYDNAGNKISIPGSSVTASSQWLGIAPHLENNQPANVVDGNSNTVWNAGNTKPISGSQKCYLYAGGGGTQCDKALGVNGIAGASSIADFMGHEVAWIMLDLGSIKNVSKIRLQENGPANVGMNGEIDTIEVSNDGVNFATVAKLVPSTDTDGWFEYPVTDKRVTVLPLTN